jgi:hypothetical protein
MWLPAIKEERFILLSFLLTINVLLFLFGSTRHEAPESLSKKKCLRLINVLAYEGAENMCEQLSFEVFVC